MRWARDLGCGETRIYLEVEVRRVGCLYATAIARQIKQDLPGCHLTWAIGSMCRTLIEGNPYVDEIWEFPMAGHGDMLASWERFEAEARERQRYHERIALKFDFYARILDFVLKRGCYSHVLLSAWNTMHRYGPRLGLFAVPLRLAVMGTSRLLRGAVLGMTGDGETPRG